MEETAIATNVNNGISVLGFGDDSYDNSILTQTREEKIASATELNIDIWQKGNISKPTVLLT